MPTIQQTLDRAIATLMRMSSAPRLDAQLILGHVLNQRREYLVAHGEQTLTDLQAQVFEKLLTLRVKGMPTAYILGDRAFYDRSFHITPHVLIPRPETEHIVEAALEWAEKHPIRRAVDVGTGSGAIGLTLAAHLSSAIVVATDVSAAALVVAQDNGADLANVCYIQADLLAPLPGPFDLICANLPYIATAEMNVLEVARFEPAVALDGGADGLALIRRLIRQATTALARAGLLLMEIGADQGLAVEALAVAAFPAQPVAILKDYSGLDRVLRVERVEQ